MPNRLQSSLDLLSDALSEMEPEDLWRLAKLGGLAWRHLAPDRERHALTHLNKAIRGLEPAIARRLVARMFDHLAAVPLEVLAATRHGATVRGDAVHFGGVARVRAQHPERLQQVLAEGRGALILSAHLGNFELALHSERQRGFPLSVVTKSVKPKALNSAWRSLRRASGVGIIEERSSLKTILATLDAGGAVVMALDQHADPGHSTRTRFFGVPAWTHRGLAFLSARRRVPVVPVFIQRREPGLHVVRYLPPIPFEPRAGESFRDAIPRQTQLYTNVIEDAVRSCPEQWTWLHKRWKPGPTMAGEPTRLEHE